jgi:hypothetical protein
VPHIKVEYLQKNGEKNYRKQTKGNILVRNGGMMVVEIQSFHLNVLVMGGSWVENKDTSQTGTRVLGNRCPFWYDTLMHKQT